MTCDPRCGLGSATGAADGAAREGGPTADSDCDPHSCVSLYARGGLLRDARGREPFGRDSPHPSAAPHSLPDAPMPVLGQHIPDCLARRR